MTARLLTTLTPPPQGFRPVVLTKRELLSGTVILLVDDFAEIEAVLPGAIARMRGLVLTLSGHFAAEKLGSALWHLRLPPRDLITSLDLLATFAVIIEDGFAAAETADVRTIELARALTELNTTRHDYHESLARLMESEERFRALVESSRDWIWATDERLIYTYCSPRVRDLLGYEPQDMLGRDFFALMPPAEVERVAPLVDAAQRACRPLVNLENMNRHRNGRLMTLETNAVPILDSRGGWRGYRGVDRDITSRKRAEEERLLLERRVLHSQKLESLGVLAGGIAHDFNNLLVAVLGNAELALTEMAPGAAGRESVVDIRRAALRASELTNQMLAYSGKGRFVIEPIDLSDLVRDIGHLLEISICKRARLQFELAAKLPAVDVDAAQIRQIVMNLVTNASEAIECTAGDGTITLRTGLKKADRKLLRGVVFGEDLPEGPYVTLEVVDTGCGMTDEVLAKLFDPFFTTKFQGRGLGLAAVQGIVRGHRGTLLIRSKLGQGTSITVLLPATADRAPVAAEPPYCAQKLWRASGTALVVDDDENVRQFTARVLERLGFTALTADNGTSGLASFRDHADKIAVVVLDLTMPGINGEQAFRQMRQIRPDVPIILASGYNEQDATSHFAGAGLAGFIKKPFTIDELTTIVRAAVER